MWVLSASLCLSPHLFGVDAPERHTAGAGGDFATLQLWAAYATNQPSAHQWVYVLAGTNVGTCRAGGFVGTNDETHFPRIEPYPGHGHQGGVQADGDYSSIAHIVIGPDEYGIGCGVSWYGTGGLADPGAPPVYAQVDGLAFIEEDLYGGAFGTSTNGQTFTRNLVVQKGGGGGSMAIVYNGFSNTLVAGNIITSTTNANDLGIWSCGIWLAQPPAPGDFFYTGPANTFAIHDNSISKMANGFNTTAWQWFGCPFSCPPEATVWMTGNLCASNGTDFLMPYMEGTFLYATNNSSGDGSAGSLAGTNGAAVGSLTGAVSYLEWTNMPYSFALLPTASSVDSGIAVEGIGFDALHTNLTWRPQGSAWDRGAVEMTQAAPAAAGGLVCPNIFLN